MSLLFHSQIACRQEMTYLFRSLFALSFHSLPWPHPIPQPDGSVFLGIPFDACVTLSNIKDLKRGVELLRRKMQRDASCSWRYNLVIEILQNQSGTWRYATLEDFMDPSMSCALFHPFDWRKRYIWLYIVFIRLSESLMSQEAHAQCCIYKHGNISSFTERFLIGLTFHWEGRISLRCLLLPAGQWFVFCFFL